MPSGDGISVPGDSVARVLDYRRQVLERRRKSLYGFLLLIAGAMILAYLQLLVLDYATDIAVTNYDSVQVALVVTLVGAAACYGIARRGAVTAAASIILGLALLIATFLDDPAQVIGGRALISFPVIIVAAGLLLPPYSTFILAGASTLTVTLLALAHNLGPVQPMSDMIVFFLLAAITWYYAGRMERANQHLVATVDEREAARVALKQLNAELEQRVAERTAELRTVNSQLERSNRIKDEFLATISHELRTPLTAILALSETLSEQIYGPLTAKQLRAAQAIGTSGQRLRTLIDNILDFSQLEAGVVAADLEPLPVQEVCRAAFAAAQELAAARQQELTFRCEAVGAASVYADRARLQQVLGGLLDNAVKFTPAGGAVGLDVLPGFQLDTLQFVVWDTGIGIAPAEQANLFNSFHQLDRRLNRRYEGAGLGLALVQRLVLLQGGTICVESTPGQGSRFIVTLPSHPPVSEAVA